MADAMPNHNTKKVIAFALTTIAVLSPLYIDRKPTVVSYEPDVEAEEGRPGKLLLPVLLSILLVASINFSCLLDRRYTRLDPYWIHRVGGSSCGIATVLAMLAGVLKWKSSLRS